MPETERFEQELRALYPSPSASATERALAAVVQAARADPPRARRWSRLVRRRRWRPILVTVGAVTALAVAGVAIAVSLLNVTSPRFRAAPGWYVGSKRMRSCVGGTRARCVQAEAWASTVPYRDCANCVPPHNTLAGLPPDGIIIQLIDARERPPYGPFRSWPPQLHASQVHGPFEGEPSRFSVVQLVARSRDGVEHSLFVWFGRPHPTAAQLARANAELQTVRP